MKRAKWYLVLLLVSIPLLVGGACGPPEVPSPSILWVSIPIEAFSTHQHTDEVMHAVVGEELTVTLGSNPTTGFQWSEEAEISDESVIKQVSHMFVGPGIDKPPGTPGEEVWIFKALKRGTTATFLEYSRPWVEEDALHWTVTITTTIK